MKMCNFSALRHMIKRLRRDASGLAMIEFAYSLPLLVGLGMYGTEAAMYVQANMRVSQLALNVADNASRIGENSALTSKQVFEGDINTIMEGVAIQARSPTFMNRARVIISSVETNASGNPFIHWQRCGGALDYDSTYGFEGKGLNDNSLSDGIGPAGKKTRPVPGSAIMFVEVAAQYEAIFGLAPFSQNRIVQTASMTVRDERDLSGIFNPTGATVTQQCT
jgi:hypothetical protein